MSEATWQSRATVPPLMRPEVIIGAASPLWGYFTGAALAGMSIWWMTRWMRPGSAEAAAKAVLEAPAAAALEAPVEVATEDASGPVAEAVTGEELPAAPVGGEAAPISPTAVEADVASEPEIAKALKPPPAARTRKPREGEPKPH